MLHVNVKFLTMFIAFNLKQTGIKFIFDNAGGGGGEGGYCLVVFL